MLPARAWGWGTALSDAFSPALASPERTAEALTRTVLDHRANLANRHRRAVDAATWALIGEFHVALVDHERQGGERRYEVTIVFNTLCARYGWKSLDEVRKTLRCGLA